MNGEEGVIKRKKYRRIKRVISHPNPLFDKWLKEWQAEAEEKNSMMKYNYQRARKSLQRYPLPLYSGRDCKLLEHFGEKICQMLDRCLEQHIQENGPIDWDQVHKIRSEPSKKKVKKKAINTSKSPGKRSKVSISASVMYKECSSRRKSREYIPAVRSGAYALLLALYNASKNENSTGFLKKKELIEVAQPLCDSSFSHAREGSHYSAWSSMSTLIKKELAKREGNPSRYSLTPEGETLSAKLMADGSSGTPECSPIPYLASCNSDDVITVESRSCSPVNPTGSPVDCQVSVASIAVNNTQAKAPSSLFTSSRNHKENFSERDLKKSKAVSSIPAIPARNSCHQDSQDLVEIIPENSERITSGTVQSVTHPVITSEKSQVSLLNTQLKDISFPLKRQYSPHPTPTPQFTFCPEEYEILLCVDNAETVGGFTGGKRSTKDIIVTELERHGIRYDVRKLHVGDFLWVCRERLSSNTGLSGITEQPRELVLPYIIERKRMDDLASSIKDGRFREQKFRLKQCGLSKPMYLVEEYGNQNLSIPEATCLQAVVNTQVVDGFTVKVTKDQRESAAFLTIMTRCLQSKYQGKAVSAVLRKDLDNQSEKFHNHEEIETSLMTFVEFNAASVKNHTLTVKEMFAKHLLQLHGLSVEKVKTVVDKFGTPSLLMSAYEKLASPSNVEQALASMKCGKSGRSLGPVLSASIARLYTRMNLQ